MADTLSSSLAALFKLGKRGRLVVSIPVALVSITLVVLVTSLLSTGISGTDTRKNTRASTSAIVTPHGVGANETSEADNKENQSGFHHLEMYRSSFLEMKLLIEFVNKNYSAPFFRGLLYLFFFKNVANGALPIITIRHWHSHNVLLFNGLLCRNK